MGNSNFNSFQATLQRRTKSLDLMIAYTYSKSIDNASSLADPGNPFDLRQMRALSAFDLKHNLVITYEYTLPVERLVEDPIAGHKDGRFPELPTPARVSP